MKRANNISYCIFSKSAAFQKIRVGGAETSLFQTALQLGKSGNLVTYVYDSCNPIYEERASIIREHSVCIISLEMPRLSRLLTCLRIPSFYQYFKILRLCKIIEKRQVDVIYSYYEPDVLSQLCKCKKKGYKFYWIMRMAGLYWYEDIKNNKSLLNMYQEWFSNIDCINYIHRGLKQLVYSKAAEVGLNISSKHTLMWDIGCDVMFKRQLMRESRMSGKNRLQLISATRFTSYQKRQDILVRAVALCLQHVDISLTLVGAGDTKHEVEKLADELGIKDHVNFIPFVSQEKLWDLILDADLFCHPTEYEGLSKIVLESMSLGVPVLVSDVPILNHFVFDGKNGFLTNNSPESWANKILVLNENRNLLKFAATVARARLEDSSFDPEFQVKEFIAFIDNVFELDDNLT